MMEFFFQDISFSEAATIGNIDDLQGNQWIFVYGECSTVFTAKFKQVLVHKVTADITCRQIFRYQNYGRYQNGSFKPKICKVL